MDLDTSDAVDLKSRWRRQIIRRRCPDLIEARRGFAAIAFVDQSNLQLPYVEISSLLVVAVYEDEFLNTDGSLGKRRPLRLCGYRVTTTSSEVHWGGAENAVLFKDLTLAPQLNASGQRIDIRKTELLELALQLDDSLHIAPESASGGQAYPRLPRLWGAFRAKSVKNLRGEGPEFEAACRDGSVSPDSALAGSARYFEGLVLHPLEWIRSQLEQAVTVFADVRDCVRPQVFPIPSFPEALIGQHGMCAYDFYHNAFRRRPLANDGHCKYETADTLDHTSSLSNSLLSPARMSPAPHAGALR